LWQEGRPFRIFGPFFRALMKAIKDGKISQREASEIFGCSYATLSRWSNKTREPYLFELHELEMRTGGLYLFGESLWKTLAYL
jgi:hypothetical protein